MKKILKSKWVFVGYIAALVALNIFVANITFVYGNSMAPALSSGDIVLTNKLFSDISLGDIVVTNRNNSLNEHLIKRVVATQGQTVEITSTGLYVDGELQVRHSYSSDSFIGPLVVPKDAVFLLGDNYDVSKDSRHIGAIPEHDIIGKVAFVLFSKSSIFE